MRILRFFSPAFVLFLIACNPPAKDEKMLPNVVIIFTDDQGYGDIGCFGATGFDTPNLDEMASQGMRFTNFYSAQPVCSASRAGLLTGCYPNRIGISGALFPRHEIGISDDEVTIAEMLKEKGYATAIFGKWHLGHHKQFLPLQHGFDEYTGVPYSNDMWPINLDGTKSPPGKGRGDFPDLPLVQGNETIELITSYADQDKLTTLNTEKAVDFIHRNKNNPFFLYVPHSMPHVPLGVSDKFRGKSEQGMYGDVMMEIDWSVGQIMEALKADGLENNTIVIFNTDNGPWLNYGNHAGSSGGLREGKTTSWEGGQRVPCIVKWPGNVPDGVICNKLASSIDFMPTIASIVGGSLPDHKIDGVNILDLWKGNFKAEPRKEFYYYFGKNNLNGVRSGNWKLVFPHTYASYEATVPKNDGHGGRRIQMNVDSLELYNLMRDPGERYNVADLYPDILAGLIAVGEKARADLGDLNVGTEGPGVRAVGKLRK
jgi:arylsulfatase A-like enzyme